MPKYFFCSNRLVVTLFDNKGRSPGGTKKSFTGRLRPEVQPLTLLYVIFERKGNLLKLTNGIPFTHLV